MSSALAMHAVPPRAELSQLRGGLVILADRLFMEMGDPELVWAGNTLRELLVPEVVEQGLDDWVVRAALVLLVDKCSEVGLVGPTLTAPRRALELLDQLDQPPDRRSRF